MFIFDRHLQALGLTDRTCTIEELIPAEAHMDYWNQLVDEAEAGGFRLAPRAG
jgi:hypothetical protein